MPLSVSPAPYAIVLPRARATGNTANSPRRRPNQLQGRALQALSHAIEYLVDSRAYAGEHPEFAAVQILTQLNREVFSNCEEVVPMRDRLKLSLPVWMANYLPFQTQSVPPAGTR